MDPTTSGPPNDDLHGRAWASVSSIFAGSLVSNTQTHHQHHADFPQTLPHNTTPQHHQNNQHLGHTQHLPDFAGFEAGPQELAFPASSPVLTVSSFEAELARPHFASSPHYLFPRRRDVDTESVHSVDSATTAISAVSVASVSGRSRRSVSTSARSGTVTMSQRKLLETLSSSASSTGTFTSLAQRQVRRVSSAMSFFMRRSSAAASPSSLASRHSPVLGAVGEPLRDGLEEDEEDYGGPFSVVLSKNSNSVFQRTREGFDGEIAQNDQNSHLISVPEIGPDLEPDTMHQQYSAHSKTPSQTTVTPDPLIVLDPPATPVLSRRGSFNSGPNFVHHHHLRISSSQQPSQCGAPQHTISSTTVTISSSCSSATTPTTFLSPSISSHKLALMVTDNKPEKEQDQRHEPGTGNPAPASTTQSPVLSRSASRASLASRKTLYIQDLAKLASASLEAASLTPTLEPVSPGPVISRQTTFALKTRSRSGSSSGSSGGLVMSSSVTTIHHNSHHHRDHATPGKRLPSRKSMTALARAGSRNASQLSLADAFGASRSSLKRNSIASRSTSTLASPRSKPEALTLYAGPSSRRPSSAVGSTNTLEGGSRHPSLPEVAAEILSPLLARTGSRVWEEIRESKGQGWLSTSRAPSVGFYDEDEREVLREMEEAEVQNRLEKWRESNGEPDDAEGLFEEKMGQVEEDYNPLTYQSQTMVGVEIDDRDSDTESEMEVFEDSSDEDDGERILHIGDLRKLKRRQRAQEKIEEEDEEDDRRSGLAADSGEVPSFGGSEYLDLGGIAHEGDDSTSDDSDDEELLLEPSHNVFFEVVDWVLGLGHESVSFSVPMAVQAASAKARARAAAAAAAAESGTSGAAGGDGEKAGEAEAEYRAQRRRVRRLERRRAAAASRARQQERRDAEQGLEFDVGLALGYAAYLVT